MIAAWLGFIVYMQATTWEWGWDDPPPSTTERLTAACQSFMDHRNLSGSPPSVWTEDPEAAEEMWDLFQSASEDYAAIDENVRRMAELDPGLLEQHPDVLQARAAAENVMKIICGAPVDGT